MSLHLDLPLRRAPAAIDQRPAGYRHDRPSGQLNLLPPGAGDLAGRRLPDGGPSLIQLVQGLLGLALFALLASLGLQLLSQRATADEQAEQARTAALRSGLAGPQGSNADQAELRRIEADLTALRRQDAALQRVQSLLASGAAGQARGHAELLLALARQADPAVWLTGLSVSGDHQALELRGRLNQPAALPPYLARLHGEPLFHGRRFAQLRLGRPTTAPALAATPLTPEEASAAVRFDFVLRSEAAGLPPSPSSGQTGSRP